MAVDGDRVAAVDCGHSAVPKFDRADDGTVVVPDGGTDHRGDRRAHSGRRRCGRRIVAVNWFFVVPYHTLTIAEPETHRQPCRLRRSWRSRSGRSSTSRLDVLTKSQRARVEATALARSAATVGCRPRSAARLIEQIRSTLRIGIACDLFPTSAQLPGCDTSTVPCPRSPVSTDPVGDPLASESGYRLELYRPSLTGDDQRVLRALADQLAVAIERSHLGREAAEAEALANIDAMRTALLHAVSHDLRTPLASIKAMVSGLLESDVTWRPEQVRDALRPSTRKLTG